MKHLIILFFAISFLYSNHIKWLGNYDKALQKARDENRVLMVLLIKDNCQKCKNIVKYLFTNKAYINKLNQSIVAVIVNIDNKRSFPIEMYWSNTYPTIFFVNSYNETFIEKPLYSATEEDIYSILSKIKNR